MAIAISTYSCIPFSHKRVRNVFIFVYTWFATKLFFIVSQPHLVFIVRWAEHFLGCSQACVWVNSSLTSPMRFIRTTPIRHGVQAILIVQNAYIQIYIYTYPYIDLRLHTLTLRALVAWLCAPLFWLPFGTPVFLRSFSVMACTYYLYAHISTYFEKINVLACLYTKLPGMLRAFFLSSTSAHPYCFTVGRRNHSYCLQSLRSAHFSCVVALENQWVK